MEKKKMTTKERGKVAWLSLLAVGSGAGIAISTSNYFSASEFDVGALIWFMISIALLTWAIIESSKIQKAINARTDAVPVVPVISTKSVSHCDNCGAAIEHSAKFCSSCGQKIPETSVQATSANSNVSGRSCPNCSSRNIIYQTITEARKSGCGTILLYVFLTLTVFGLLIVIPLMLRKKTETVTYAVCQNCGTRWRVA